MTSIIVIKIRGTDEHSRYMNVLLCVLLGSIRNRYNINTLFDCSETIMRSSNRLLESLVIYRPHESGRRRRHHSIIVFRIQHYIFYLYYNNTEVLCAHTYRFFINVGQSSMMDSRANNNGIH